MALATKSSQVGACDARPPGARFVGLSGAVCRGGSAEGVTPAETWAGFPTIVVPIDRRSAGVNQTISVGGVTTILPMMAAGTPSSFAIRAIETVAAPD